MLKICIYLIKQSREDKFEKKNESVVFNLPIDLNFQNKLDKQSVSHSNFNKNLKRNNQFAIQKGKCWTQIK